MKTIRLKVKREAYPWLNHAAYEVNQVWNWAAEYCQSRIRNGLCAPSGYDLNFITGGWAKGFGHIKSATIQLTLQQYALKRRVAKKHRLKWRISGGPRRSLGWVPVKGETVTRKGNSFRFAGKTFRVFENERLRQWRGGSFAQDSVGDWWLCLSVDDAATAEVAPCDAVGVDLGLRACATTSDGDKLESGIFRAAESSVSNAQRRGHRRQAKRINRKVARCRADAAHKFSTMLVRKYQRIFVGDVSTAKLVKTRMAKSVLDAGWCKLKTQLEYKCQQAAREFEVISEYNTTRACSGCGALTGPTGLAMLSVRNWMCDACGASHDRDINAAKNILFRAEAYGVRQRERGKDHECRRYGGER